MTEKKKGKNNRREKEIGKRTRKQRGVRVTLSVWAIVVVSGCLI